MTQEKIRYGISNVHYAIQTKDINGKAQFGPLKKLPYATNFTREPAGEDIPVYADDDEIVRLKNDQGFTGTLSLTRVDDDFYADVLGRIKASDGTYEHEVGTESSVVALTYEFKAESGKKPIRGVLYNVTFGQPGESSATSTDTVEVQTVEVPFTATPVQLLDEAVVDGKLRTCRYVGKQTSQGTNDNVFLNWHKEVVLPTRATDTP